MKNSDTVRRKLSSTAFQVFSALALYANNPQGIAGFYINDKLIAPSRAKLGAILGLSVRSVANGIKNLEELGWIATKKRRYDASSIIYLTMPNINLSDDGKTFRDCTITLQQAKLLKEEGIVKRRGQRLAGSGIDDEAPIGLADAVKDVFIGFESGAFVYSNEQLLPFGLSHKSTRRHLEELYPEEFDVAMNAELESWTSKSSIDSDGLYLEEYEVPNKSEIDPEKL